VLHVAENRIEYRKRTSQDARLGTSSCFAAVHPRTLFALPGPGAQAQCLARVRGVVAIGINDGPGPPPNVSALQPAVGAGPRDQRWRLRTPNPNDFIDHREPAAINWTLHMTPSNHKGIGSDFAGDPGTASFSVIIEWENAKLSELVRTRRMLAALAEQARSIEADKLTALDLVVLYDPEVIAHDLIKSTIAEAMAAGMPFAQLKLVPANGKRYYELKNHGATFTTADVLVFLDSDVIPEPGWLRRLLVALRDGAADVVGGNTYVAMDSLYSRSFALFWFFPLRTQADCLRESELFYANNVAFSRAVFCRHSFPVCDKFRGQCVDLAATLRAHGVKIHLHEGARVNHPPPNGVRHFVARALCDGHDQAAIARERGVHASAGNAWKRFKKNVRKANRSITSRSDSLRFGAGQRLAARSVALAYYALSFVGELTTIANPSLIPRCFPI
jgi:hypothetical protein